MNVVTLSMLKVDCSQFKDQLAREALSLVDSNLQYVLSNIRKRGKYILETYNVISQRTKIKLENPEQYSDFYEYFQGCQKEQKSLEDEFVQIKRDWELLEQFYFAVSDEDVETYWELYSRPQELAILLYNREVKLLQEKNSFVKALEEEKHQFQQDLFKYETEIDVFKSFYDTEKAEEVIYIYISYSSSY